VSYLESIAELHAQHFTPREIAAALGCSLRTVGRWRSSQGLTPVPPEFSCHPVTPERLAAAAAMVADGAPFREIERTLHMSRDTLVRHFPGAQWTPKQAGELAAAVRQAKREERKAALGRQNSFTSTERKAA